MENNLVPFRNIRSPQALSAPMGYPASGFLAQLIGDLLSPAPQVQLQPAQIMKKGVLRSALSVDRRY